MNVLPDALPAFAAPHSGTSPVPAVRSFAPVNPLAQSDWDARLEGHPRATFFHTAAWARVLHETYGHQPAYFCRVENGALSGLLPLMEVSSPLTGRRGVSLPFTDVCPWLETGSPSGSELFHQAREYGRSRGWKYLECRGTVPAAAGALPSLAFFGHVVDLTGGAAARFARLDPAVRRGVRKAESAGLSVRFDQTAEALRTFFDLHCLTRRKHGVPPQPFRFFAGIQRHVLAPGCGWVVTVEQGGRPLAAAIFFHFGRQAIYKFGASDPGLQHLRPSNLLLWRAIEWYAARGCWTLHLGRTSLAHDGLRRFKLGFGAREERLEYCRYDFSRAAFVTSVDRVDGWFNSVFRALPGPLLRAAGAALYPHLS